MRHLQNEDPETFRKAKVKMREGRDGPRGDRPQRSERDNNRPKRI